jgi:hypothetical protein
MKLLKTKGITNVTLLVFIQDSSATTGTGLAGVTASMITAYYARVEDDNDVTIAEISLVDAVGTGTDHTDGVIEEISANLKGWYRLDIPDACCATGADTVGINLQDNASNNIAQVTIEIQLIDVNLSDSVRFGMTALPNAAADAAAGLPISDAGGLDLDAKLANTNEVTAARMGALTDWINGERLDLLLDAVLVDTAEIGAAGGGLTSIPWNSAWDAEVESEVNDALVVLQLDHLLHVADASTTTNSSIIAKMVSKSGTPAFSSFNNTTDSLEALRDNQSGATAAAIADAVWDEDATGHQTGGTFGQAIGDPGSNTETMYDAVVTDAAGTNVAADVIAVKAETVSIVADTNELQGDWTNGGRLDLIVDAILVDTAQVGVAVGASISADIAAVKAETVLIVADTNELQGDWTNGGRLDLIIDAVLVDTGTTIPGTITTVDSNVDAILVDTGTTLPATLATIDTNVDDIETAVITNATGTDIAADIIAMKVDTAATLVDTAEIGTAGAGLTNVGGAATELSGIPATTSNVLDQVQFLFMALRNKIDVTATVKEVHNNAGTVIGTKTLSDDGTTYSETKMA